MGKKEPRKMIKAADLIPMPNQNIAIGIQASGGMGRMISTSGVNVSLAIFDQPMRMPRGTAITMAIENPQNTR